MSVATRLGALAAVYAVATALVGWWSLPIVSAAWALIAARRRTASVGWLAALGAAIGWLALLAYDAARGPAAALATTLGGVMRVPAPALVLVTLGFAALVAGSTGALVGAVARPRQAGAKTAGEG